MNKRLICAIPPASTFFAAKTDGCPVFSTTAAVWAFVK